MTKQTFEGRLPSGKTNKEKETIYADLAELGLKPPEPKPPKKPTRQHIRMARALIDDLLYPSRDGIMPELDNVAEEGFTAWKENKQWMADKLNPVLASLTSLVYEPHTSAALRCIDPQMVKQARNALKELYEPNQYLIKQERELLEMATIVESDDEYKERGAKIQADNVQHGTRREYVLDNCIYKPR